MNSDSSNDSSSSNSDGDDDDDTRNDNKQGNTSNTNNNVDSPPPRRKGLRQRQQSSTSSPSMSTRSSSTTLRPDNSHILSVKYLDRHTNKKDLVRRLRNIVDVLRQDESVEPDSPEFPGLAALVVNGLTKYLNHGDKQVRLYTVLACMELFTIYAPDAPWDTNECCDIFSQTICQLANLAHTTSAKPNNNFTNYIRILELLANVKIGVVLVEISKDLQRQHEMAELEQDIPTSQSSTISTAQSSSSPTSSPSNRALELLAELFRTILQSVRLEHPPEVSELAQRTIAACLEEYYEEILIPIPLLDELLTCIGPGPRVLVLSNKPSQNKRSSQHNKSKTKSKSDNGAPVPYQVEQLNPSYLVAASVLRKAVDRLSTPIANLLNGLLNTEDRVCRETNILTETTNVVDQLFKPQVQGQSQKAILWSIIYELSRIAPPMLTTVVGTISSQLTLPDSELRLVLVHVLGKIFSTTPSLATQFRACVRQWWRRAQDKEPTIRMAACKHIVQFLISIVNKIKLNIAGGIASDTTLSSTTNTTSSPKGNKRGGDNVTPTTVMTTDQDDYNDLMQEAHDILMSLLDDPDGTVRLKAIHTICDLAHGHPNAVSPPLLKAVGARVAAKVPGERKDALTGLAQIYQTQFVQPHLSKLTNSDNVELEVICQVIQETTTSISNKRLELSGWIPQRVMECASYSDAVDADMRHRLFQIVDDVLLGNPQSSTATTATASGGKKRAKWSSTAKAVGLAFVLHSLEAPLLSTTPTTNAYRWFSLLLQQRSKLQRVVSQYIDARSAIRTFEAGSEEALTANAKAEELLEQVASFTGREMQSVERDPVLEKFHSAKDKHMFRILSTIATPTHSSSARSRALDELPKRAATLGSEISSWVKTLVRRCAMGNLINVDIIHHCILLAQECLREEDIPGSSCFLACVKLAADHFPELCAMQESFGTLVEMFTECRDIENKKFQQELKNSGILTALSSILSKTATTGKTSDAMDQNLQKELLNMCCRDGTPEQARHAVRTMAAMLNPKEERLTQEQNDAFAPLLKALTSPSRLWLNLDPRSNQSFKLISVLTALSELAYWAPSVFKSSRGNKALRFALDAVLLDQTRPTEIDNEDSDKEKDEDTNDGDHDDDDGGDSGDDKLASPSSTTSRRRKSTPVRRRSSYLPGKNATPNVYANLLEDEKLSVTCRRICAAIEFLVSHIRNATIMSKTDALAARAPKLFNQQTKSEKEGHQSDSSSTETCIKTTTSQAVVSPPDTDLVQSVFDVLCQILHDYGLPPSTEDRQECKSRQERAALRQCAAIHILKLCDNRLQLDQKYLTPAKWHILAQVFLDTEHVVRDKVMDELGLMLTGNGCYGKVNGAPVAMIPRLRFLSLVTLCTDGDHGADHSPANGNAANVGKRSNTTKTNAMECVMSLRKVCETSAAQYRALGKDAERKFETQMKMILMPEYAVPYAFHLLAYRKETPSAGGATYSKSTGLTQTTADGDHGGGGDREIDESQQRVLRKRLKWLFEPLVQSLGESADNISFLLRMSEITGKHFHPIGSLQTSLAPSSAQSVSLRLSTDTEGGASDQVSMSSDSVRIKNDMAAAKLKIVCAAAREVLLSFVKKDVNLTVYPGQIQLPGNLFRRNETVIPKVKSAPRASIDDSINSSLASSEVVTPLSKVSATHNETPSGTSRRTRRSNTQPSPASRTRHDRSSAMLRQSLDTIESGEASSSTAEVHTRNGKRALNNTIAKGDTATGDNNSASSSVLDVPQQKGKRRRNFAASKSNKKTTNAAVAVAVNQDSKLRRSTRGNKAARESMDSSVTEGGDSLVSVGSVARRTRSSRRLAAATEPAQDDDNDDNMNNKEPSANNLTSNEDEESVDENDELPTLDKKLQGETPVARRKSHRSPSRVQFTPNVEPTEPDKKKNDIKSSGDDHVDGDYNDDHENTMDPIDFGELSPIGPVNSPDDAPTPNDDNDDDTFEGKIKHKQHNGKPQQNGRPRRRIPSSSASLTSQGATDVEESPTKPNKTKKDDNGSRVLDLGAAHTDVSVTRETVVDDDEVDSNVLVVDDDDDDDGTKTTSEAVSSNNKKKEKAKPVVAVAASRKRPSTSPTTQNDNSTPKRSRSSRGSVPVQIKIHRSKVKLTPSPKRSSLAHSSRHSKQSRYSSTNLDHDNDDHDDDNLDFEPSSDEEAISKKNRSTRRSARNKAQSNSTSSKKKQTPIKKKTTTKASKKKQESSKSIRVRVRRN